jgi:purine nucleoside permease
MPSAEAPEPAPDTPCVLKAEAYGADTRYWTGRMLERWPESLRDREKAAETPYRTAKRLAIEFNAVTANVRWAAEPVDSAG